MGALECYLSTRMFKLWQSWEADDRNVPTSSETAALSRHSTWHELSAYVGQES